AQQKKPQQSSKPQKPPKRQHYTPLQKPPPPQPSVLADGGWSLEPIYWLNREQPDLRGGKLLVGVNGALDYLGHANPSIGGVLSMPAGKHNSLRFSYFRVQGHSDTTLTQNATLFTEGYNSGDFLNASYTLQVAKLSWDYLSYTWFFPKTKIWMKTLWQMQFATIGTNIAAPLKPVTTNVSGNVDYNTATGSAKIFLPTFGLEFEQPVTRHFRWWVKGSGFGIPHHGDIWDGEAAIGLRMGQFELIGGAKAFHFKTSPQGAQYFVDTLAGPFVGLRWYWTKRPPAKH
ncbi:MAG: hypothetical protein ACRD34_17200, partial [Bryobacteraceae bacterium]